MKTWELLLVFYNILQFEAFGPWNCHALYKAIALQVVFYNAVSHIPFDVISS